MSRQAHKATWIGPDAVLRLDGQPPQRMSRGDEFEIPAGTTVGGEDVQYRITGGPEHTKLSDRAKEASIKGYTKMSRRELADALAAHEADEKATAETTDGDDKE